MTKGNIEAIYPLSPIQAGLLFHTIQTPDSGAYFQQYHCRLDGRLNEDAWRAAWEEIVARHGVLRTLFTWERRDRPLQLVRGRVELAWRTADWRDLDPERQAAELADWLLADRRQGFNLSQAPLMRLALIQTGSDSHRFVWSYHHILLDGWSTYMVLKEVFALYAEIIQGETAARPAPRPYKDFIDWLDSQDTASAERFWRQELAGFTAATPLPLAHPAPMGRPAPATGHGQALRRLPPELTEGLVRFAQGHQLTLNTLIQGAWALLLQRMSGEEDVLFGTTVSGRPPDLAGVEKMVGLFINTLPYRVAVDPDAPLVEWLRGLQARSVELRRYENTSLARVQAWGDTPAGQRLFDSLVVFENYPVEGALVPAGSGLDLSEATHIEQSHYPLALLVVPGERLQFYLVYDRTRYDEETADRLLGCLETVLGEMVVDPGRPVGDLSVLPAEERRRALVDWNDTARPFRRDALVHELIEEWAARTPGAVAARFENQTLSYHALDRRANRLAQALLSRGLRPGEPVVLCAGRSLELVIGLVGILKAGGAYVPLDPGYPDERITMVLEDLSAAGGQVLIVTQSALRERLADSGPLVLLDDLALTEPEPTEGWLALNLSPEQPAYIIFTSGSTGRPKGVQVSHRSLVHSTTARFAVYPEPLASFLLLSSFAFDSSLVGIFWTLCTGGALVLTPERSEQDVQLIADLVAHYQITHLLCLPSLYDLILEYADASRLRSLRAVMVAGENCPPTLAPRHYERLPDAALYNEYGPTEGTVWATVYRLRRGETTNPVPIGRPIPNMRAYILDDRRQPVPIGVAGELYLGGEGIAQGYFNRPDLTAERFISHDFGDGLPVERLYRTGDLARFRADGEIEFLGRVDHQVKIRGYRVELGEIEATLAGHPAIVEAAVVLHDMGGDLEESVDGLAALLATFELDEAEALLANVEESVGSDG